MKPPQSRRVAARTLSNNQGRPAIQNFRLSTFSTGRVLSDFVSRASEVLIFDFELEKDPPRVEA
jgi:hypothetical protein